ncbi:MYB-CC type transcription factor, LHEQLE-containing domain, partial [Dillenia turbinata]
ALDLGMASNRSNSSGKESLKWTQELHNRFEEAVNKLGGAESKSNSVGATPKGILNAMGVPGLTIYHVKSHLQPSMIMIKVFLSQKYRISKFIPETERGKLERRNISEILPNFSTTSAAQLNEALQMQMEAQRRLNDQLEVQRSLKLKIEAQGRFLERIAEEHRNHVNVSKPSRQFSPMSLPSLCEEYESNGKDFESDKEADKRSEGEVLTLKRQRCVDNDVIQQRLRQAALNSEFANQSMLVNNGAKIPLPAQEIGFQWNVTACESLVPSFL